MISVFKEARVRFFLITKTILLICRFFPYLGNALEYSIAPPGRYLNPTTRGLINLTPTTNNKAKETLSPLKGFGRVPHKFQRKVIFRFYWITKNKLNVCGIIYLF